MRSMVTGAAGFIGSHLCEALLGRGHDVIGVDNFDDYYPRSIKAANLERLQHPGFAFLGRDVSELVNEDLAGVDYVFHLAARPGVRSSWGDGFRPYVERNILATHHLLELIAAGPISKLVVASSSSVYGDAGALPTSETACPEPISPYGVSKLACERLCEAYGKASAIPIVLLRYFTVYGPRQRPDMAFHRFIKAVLGGEPLILNGDGEQSRDFTYVSDIVEGTIAAALSAVAGEALNLGGASTWTLKQVIELIERLSERHAVVRTGKAQAGDVRHTRADINKAARLIGYTPRVSLLEGLERELDWFRAAPTLVDAR